MRWSVSLFVSILLVCALVIAPSSSRTTYDFVVVDPEPTELSATGAEDEGYRDKSILEKLGWIVFILLIFIIARKLYRDSTFSRGGKRGMYSSEVKESPHRHNHPKYKMKGIPALKLKKSGRKN